MINLIFYLHLLHLMSRMLLTLERFNLGSQISVVCGKNLFELPGIAGFGRQALVEHLNVHFPASSLV